MKLLLSNVKKTISATLDDFFSALRKQAGMSPDETIVCSQQAFSKAQSGIVYELPLHLCSMTGIFCLSYEFCLKKSLYVRSVLGQAMYALCLPGALMAILFPNGTIYPIIHYISLESYLFHSLIIAYICIRLIDKGILPGIKEACKSILFLLVIVPPVYLFNVIFDTNFMFVIWPSSGSPLYGFYKAGGYAGYRVGFAFVALVVIYIMNILYELVHVIVKILSHRK